MPATAATLAPPPRSASPPGTRPGVQAPPRPSLGGLATAALRAEALLTPKPGLVDGRGSGAHHDMDLDLLLVSVDVLSGWFDAIERSATGRSLDPGLMHDVAGLGVRAEAELLDATGGVNTHRGALFTLGLLVAGAAATGARTALGALDAAGALARLHTPRTAAPTHGDGARRLVPGAGALGEARAGFPAVGQVALPALWRRRAMLGEHVAQLDTLLELVAAVDDTCVLHRGSRWGLRVARTGAAAVLAAGGSSTRDGRAALARFDARLCDLRLSPGGSADLLAATLLVDALEVAWTP